VRITPTSSRWPRAVAAQIADMPAADDIGDRGQAVDVNHLTKYV